MQGAHPHCTEYTIRVSSGPQHFPAAVLFTILLNMLERSGATGAPTLVDWAKPSDWIKHQILWETLRRLGVPAALVAAAQSLYALPLFRAITGGASSEWHWEERGIRQGCPLSPYLFDFSRGTQRGWYDLSFGEVLYADDTALVVDTEE